AVLVEHGCLDRSDFLVETPLVPGLGGLLLGGGAEGIDVVAAQPATCCDAFSCGVLIGHVDRPRFGAGTACFSADVGAESDTTHCLDTACYAGVDGVGTDQPCDEVGCLLCGTALRVDGGGSGGVWQTCVQPCGAGRVV